MHICLLTVRDRYALGRTGNRGGGRSKSSKARKVLRALVGPDVLGRVRTSGGVTGEVAAAGASETGWLGRARVAQLAGQAGAVIAGASGEGWRRRQQDFAFSRQQCFSQADERETRARASGARIDTARHNAAVLRNSRSSRESAVGRSRSMLTPPVDGGAIPFAIQNQNRRGLVRRCGTGGRGAGRRERRGGRVHDWQTAESRPRQPGRRRIAIPE